MMSNLGTPPTATVPASATSSLPTAEQILTDTLTLSRNMEGVEPGLQIFVWAIIPHDFKVSRLPHEMCSQTKGAWSSRFPFIYSPAGHCDVRVNSADRLQSIGNELTFPPTFGIASMDHSRMNSKHNSSNCKWYVLHRSYSSKHKLTRPF